MKLILLVIFMLLLMSAMRAQEAAQSKPPVWAEGLVQTGYDPSVMKGFLQTLQTSLEKDDVQTLSSLFVYPLSVGGKSIKSREQFIRNYKKIFTPKLKEAVLSETYETMEYHKSEIEICGGLWVNVGRVMSKEPLIHAIN